MNLFFFYVICVTFHKLSLCEFAITKLADVCKNLFELQQSSSSSIATLQGGVIGTTKVNSLIIESLKNVIEQVGSKRVWTFMEHKN